MARARKHAGEQKSSAINRLDKHDLYVLCVQNPEWDARMLRAIYAGGVAGGRGNRGVPPRTPRTFGEDFCATAALSRAFVAADPRARAIGVDHDPEVLAHAKHHPRVRLIESDVLRVNEPVDLLAVLNYSICELHSRRALVKYLRHARSRLNPQGVFACDIYAGDDAYYTGTTHQRIRPRPPATPDMKITYSWEQRTSDPLSGRVLNAMHFEVRGGGGGAKPRTWDDAFIYDWRLWGIPELRDAMLDAGFARTQVYQRVPHAADQRGKLFIQPLDNAEELADSFNVYVVGRLT